MVGQSGLNRAKDVRALIRVRGPERDRSRMSALRGCRVQNVEQLGQLGGVRLDVAITCRTRHNALAASKAAGSASVCPGAGHNR